MTEHLGQLIPRPWSPIISFSSPLSAPGIVIGILTQVGGEEEKSSFGKVSRAPLVVAPGHFSLSNTHKKKAPHLPS